MNSSYFECPEEDIDVCDFQVDPIDFEVQEPIPFENHDFQDIQFEDNSGIINFDVQQDNLHLDVSNYESESDEDSLQQLNLTVSRTCDSRTVQKTIKKENPEKRKIKKWTEEENKSLENLFQLYKGEWEVIAKFLKGRTVSQCKQHFARIHTQEKKKRQWTTAEDEIILSFPISDQFNNWASIAQSMKLYIQRELQGRTGKQVREHYLNQLRPEINKDQWSEAEDKLLIEMQEKYGSKWSLINKYFEGRSEIMLKNRYKKLSKTVDHQPQSKPKFNFPISQQSNTLSFI